MTEKQFVEMIGPLAAADMQQSGILASVTVAQACLESGYGSTDLAKNANNLFGMKCILSGNTWKSVWDEKSKYTKQTKEQDKNGKEYTVAADFRKYPDISKSIRDHSLYLTQAKNGSKLRYAGLTDCRDYKKAAQLIKDGGYATDTKYVQKICSLIERWDLTRFDIDKEEKALNIVNVISSENVPQWGNQKQFIAIHYLGVVGQNNKVESGGYGAHYYIYWDGTIYQAADHSAILWQVGTGGYYTQKHPTARNANTIGIELCVKCDGNANNPADPYWYFTEETQQAAVWLVKKLMSDLGIPAENVLRHYDIVNKHCPAPYVNNNKYKTSWTWEEFKAKLSDGGAVAITGSSSGETKWYRVRKSWSDESSQIGAWADLELAKAGCKAGYTVFDWNGNAVYSAASGSTSSNNTSATSNKKELVAAGQTHANNFCSAGITVDGVRGSATKKAGVKVLQTALNLAYNAGLAVDGIAGSKTLAALKGKTVRKGDKGYLVTALEILLMLKGYNPNGVGMPRQIRKWMCFSSKPVSERQRAYSG